MTFEEVMPVLFRLATATDAFAAIGAYLATSEPGQAADPRLTSAFRDVADAAGLDDLSGLAPAQRAMLLGIIRLVLRQAGDLVGDPTRPPGWAYTDPVILEGQGRGSMMIPGLLAGAAAELAAVTSFLDVGVGVGRLSIAATQVWPQCSVVGIDVFEPALELGRANVAEAGLGERISLRNQDVLALEDVDAYDCAWLPSFFFSEDALPKVTARVVEAIRPGGWVVVGRYEPPPDPLARATVMLRTIRDGGCQISVESATDLLRGAGCTAIRPLVRTWPAPMGFVIGQKA